jgi:hypothetical protein
MPLKHMKSYDIRWADVYSTLLPMHNLVSWQMMMVSLHLKAPLTEEQGPTQRRGGM